MFTRFTTLALSVLVAGVVSGCSGGSEASTSQAATEQPPAVADLTGEMEVNPVSWEDVERGSGQVESREGIMTGSLTLQANGSHTGFVEMSLSMSTAGSMPPPRAQHAWGTLEAVLDDKDDNPCTGSIAWSSFTKPTETGGSLHLRCKDNTVLGANLAITSIDSPSSGGTWRYNLRLTDGFYIKQ
jgi:hypothetical protein